MAAIPRQLNPLLRGWIKYYGRFTRAPLGQSFDSQSDNGGLDDAKVQTLYGRKAKTGRVLERLSRERLGLFAHWKIGMRGSFA